MVLGAAVGVAVLVLGATVVGTLVVVDGAVERVGLPVGV